MRNIAIYSIFFSLFILACSGGEEVSGTDFVPSDIPEEDAGEYCSHPGSTVPCDDVCEDGYRECGSDNELGECVCPDGGAAGSSGSAGEAGSSGSSGSAGSAGSSGQGGSSGEAGSAGSAGSGGTAGSSGSSGQGGSAGSEPFSVECDQYGVPGKVVVYMQGPLPLGNGLILAGWIDYPNWMGDDADHAWGLWYQGEDGDNTAILQMVPEIVSGTYLEMGPGSHPYPTTDSESTILENTDYWCEEGDCPYGTLVVCRGKDEVCALRNGELTGSMEYVGLPWPNLLCQVE
ncbi:hypothetical protein GF391_02470 [Candidatus Uhrbacteria bacterium]|nr:hypothetical protein [Candidatus Uhrbacteria bacterium]